MRLQSGLFEFHRPGLVKGAEVCGLLITGVSTLEGLCDGAGGRRQFVEQGNDINLCKGLGSGVKSSEKQGGEAADDLFFSFFSKI
ncbi:MAG: hypothetical protein IPJ82_00535 [Lewinellaceae bacterium]|nr:hypothetical protein [Lewinellaceae bacterium]